MWTQITINIAKSIGKAIFLRTLEKQTCKERKEELGKICSEKFNGFADTSLDTDEFYNFINSEKFIVILRNFYYTISDGKSRKEYIEDLCKITKSICPKSQDLDIRNFFKKIDSLFCSELSKIIEKSNELSALLSILTISNRIIIEKINNNQENLIRYLKSTSKETFKFNDEIIEIYHKTCVDDFSTISFAGIVGAEVKKARKLEELYVENNFQLYSKEYNSDFEKYDDESETTKLIKLENFFDYCNRIVILGGAGFGKTTSINYLFCNYEKIFQITALKIKINLKEYASNIYSNNQSILDCIVNEFKKRVPEGKLQDYDVKVILAKNLEDGKCLVIFDAIDEISSQAMRNRIRDELSNFCNVYYLNRYIITSREVGYLKNKFDDSFLHTKISLFSDEQIDEYVENWSKINLIKNHYSKFDEIFEIEVEKAKCKELIRNPIILVLALLIFNAENNLPHKKTEFYRKCVQTFLISRENRKEAFSISAKMKDILGDDLIIPKVAHYKFNNTKNDDEYIFSMSELKEAVMKALDVEDKRNWINAIGEFVEYLIDRTELIKEVDVEKYDFAHKTFSEYFLAVYFAKDVKNEELIKILNEWIGDANYDELARLIIEVIIEKNDSTQHKLLIDNLFNQIENNMCNLYNATEQNNYINSREKVCDYTSILFDLFQNGLIQPKFQNKFYLYLIKHPMIISSRMWMYSRGLKKKVKIKCDVDLLLQLFNEMSEDNNTELTHLISILYYFSQEFGENSDSIENIFLKKTFQYFNYRMKNYKVNDLKDYSDKSDEIIDFYLNDNFDKVINSPELYLLILKSLLMKNQQNKINYASKLLKFSFEPVQLFTSFINPKLLYGMIADTFSTPESFLITLIALIKCNKFKFAHMIEYVLKNRSRFSSGMDFEKTKKSIRKLMQIFINDLTKEQFIDKIIFNDIYNKKYDHLYDDLYECFEKYENEDFVRVVERNKKTLITQVSTVSPMETKIANNKF